MIANKIKAIGATVLATTMLLGGTVSASKFKYDPDNVTDPRLYASEIKMNQKYIINTQYDGYSEPEFYIFKYTPSETGLYTFMMDDYDSNKNTGYVTVYEDELTEYYYEFSSYDYYEKIIMTKGHTYYFMSYPSNCYFSFKMTGYVKSGWNKIDGEWYYYDDELYPLSGIVDLAGSKYIFSSKGMMYTGWVLYQSNWYYCGTDGKIRSGWLKSGNDWYYLGDSKAYKYGQMYRNGSYLIGDHYYYFDETGRMLKNGWVKNVSYNSSYYEYYYVDENGYVVTNGWKQIGGVWYYFYNSVMQRDCKQRINGDYYVFADDGHMIKGWVYYYGDWFYADTDGKLVTGWKQINGSWYYFDSYYEMHEPGMDYINGIEYFFLSSGEMATGWQKLYDYWYYYDSNGQVVTGWYQIQGKWYFFNSEGEMLKGWQKLGGSWYYLGTDGVMATGWQKLGGSWYYFGTDGVMATGWKQLSGVWYYFDNGVMLTGTHVLNGKTYKFDSNGHWINNA